MKTYTQDELDEVLRLHQLWLCDNGGSRADLSDATLSSADLSSASVWTCAGVVSSTVAFSDHGERGRPLLCVVIDDQPTYFCGCFRGSEQELRAYIDAGDCALRDTRTTAVDFVSAQIKRMLKGGVK